MAPYIKKYHTEILKGRFYWIYDQNIPQIFVFKPRQRKGGKMTAKRNVDRVRMTLNGYVGKHGKYCNSPSGWESAGAQLLTTFVPILNPQKAKKVT